MTAPNLGPCNGPGGGSAAQERRAALQSLARLFGAPETFGVAPGTVLVKPHGFDLRTAQMDPMALKRPRAKGTAKPRAPQTATLAEPGGASMARFSSAPGSTKSVPGGFGGPLATTPGGWPPAG